MDQTREEIEKHLESLHDRLEKIDSMNYYVSKIYTKDIQFALTLAERALKASREEEYLKGAAQALLNKSILSWAHGEYNSMLQYISESENIMRQLTQPAKQGLDRLLNLKGTFYYNQGNYSKALSIFEEALTLAHSAGNFDTCGKIYSNLSLIYHTLQNYNKALEYSLNALKVLQSSRNQGIIIGALNNAGSYCTLLEDFPRAFSFFEEARQVIKTSGLEEKEPMILESESAVHQKMGQYDKAEELLTLALEKSRALKDPEVEITALWRFGNLYIETGRLDKAEEYLEEALECSEKYGIYYHQHYIHENLKNLYIKKDDYKKAFYHLDFCEKYNKNSFDRELNNKMSTIESDILRQANKRIRIISSIGQKITSTLDLDMVLDVIYENINTIMEAAVFGIARVIPERKQIEYALFVEDGVRLDTLYIDMDDKSTLAALAVREKKDIFIADFNKEYWDYLPESKGKKATLFGNNTETLPQSILCCPLMIAGEATGVITVQSYTKNAYSISDMDSLKALASYVAIALKNAGQSGLIRQQNKKLSKANRQLEIMMNEVQQKNEQILSSIGYAERIQSSILPSTGIIENFFSDCFLLYKPRDIVGGDLYWFRKDSRGLLCIIGDCTGHGIPGALMVMTVNTLLTKINDDDSYDNPALLLAKMNRLLKKTLKQDARSPGSLTDDGADLGISFIPHNRSSITFAGANQSLYYIADNQVFEAKGDPVSIGYKGSNTDFSYTNHRLPATAGASYYMITDGYKDQIGGTRGFPLGCKKFKQLIISLKDNSMDEQKIILEKKLLEYSREEKQIDDITVLGFRI